MAEKFETWGFVEIFGHTKLAGRLSEENIAGTMLLRIDVPHGETFRTQYQGGSSIFALHPTDEATARALASRISSEPPYRYMLPVASIEDRSSRPIDREPDHLSFAGDDEEFPG